MNRAAPPREGRSYSLGPRTARQFAELHADGLISAATFIEDCTHFVAGHVGCARMGIWQLIETGPDRRVLWCRGMFDRSVDRMVTTAEADDAGAYFLALVHTGYINGSDVASRFATSACAASRAASHSYKSLLAASLAVNGKVFGVLTCTEVDRR